jgi:hypothetical protein
MRWHYAHNNHWQWVEGATGQEMSELGKNVANIIGFVGGGIYNAPIKAQSVDWTHPERIEVNWSGELCNYDFMTLSALWIACHRSIIRVSISVATFGILKLKFWQRSQREGDIFKRLPDCEAMIELIYGMYENEHGE